MQPAFWTARPGAVLYAAREGEGWR